MRIAEINRERKRNEHKLIPSFRFVFSAIELLVIHRYLDEEKSFYELAEKCLKRVAEMNDLLNQWGIIGRNVGQYFLRFNKESSDDITEFLAKLEAAHKILLKLK